MQQVGGAGQLQRGIGVQQLGVLELRDVAVELGRAELGLEEQRRGRLARRRWSRRSTPTQASTRTANEADEQTGHHAWHDGETSENGYQPLALAPRTVSALRARGPRAVAGDYARFFTGLAAGLPWTLAGSRGEFSFRGESYSYLYHRYKHTWLTERAVEVPIVQAIVDRVPRRARARGGQRAVALLPSSATSWSTSMSGRPASSTATCSSSTTWAASTWWWRSRRSSTWAATRSRAIRTWRRRRCAAWRRCWRRAAGW